MTYFQTEAARDRKVCSLSVLPAGCQRQSKGFQLRKGKFITRVGIHFSPSPDVLRAATYLVSRNTALVSVIGDPDAPQQPGKYFWFRACQEGFLSPSLTGSVSGQEHYTLSSCLIQEWAQGELACHCDFTHQRSCICTLIHERFTALVTGEIYSLSLLWQILYVTLYDFLYL